MSDTDETHDEYETLMCRRQAMRAEIAERQAEKFAADARLAQTLAEVARLDARIAHIEYDIETEIRAVSPETARNPEGAGGVEASSSPHPNCHDLPLDNAPAETPAPSLFADHPVSDDELAKLLAWKTTLEEQARATVDHAILANIMRFADEDPRARRLALADPGAAGELALNLMQRRAELEAQAA